MSLDLGSTSLDSSDRAERAVTNFAALRRFRENGVLCDVVLKVATNNNAIQQILAHKVVLAAEIPYFESMFPKNLIEITPPISVFIHGVEPDILQAVVDHAYKEEVSLPEDRVVMLLRAARMFQVPSLHQKCCTLIADNLQHSSCLRTRTLADSLNCRDLYDACTVFIRTNFEMVASCDDFLSLAPQEIIDIISSDKVYVTKEEKIYDAVLKWVYHDFPNRKVECPAIMSHVRFPFVSYEYLCRVVDVEYLMQTDIQCKEYLQEAYSYNRQRELCGEHDYSPRFEPRKVRGIDDMFIAVGGLIWTPREKKVDNDMVKYNPVTDKWTKLGVLPKPKFGTCACYHDGYIFVLGGFTRKMKPSGRVQRYNIKQAKWEDVRPMRTPRGHHSVGMIFGLIYVTGGKDRNGIVLQSTECYYPGSNVWVVREDMKFSRMQHGMTGIHTYLFVAGGHDGVTVHNTAEFYDPSENTWTLASYMPNPRYGLRAAYLGGLIYVVGGSTCATHSKQACDIVESYDINTNEWKRCAPLQIPRTNMGLVAYKDNLYACGGIHYVILTSVEKFNPSSNSWVNCANAKSPKAFFGLTST